MMTLIIGSCFIIKQILLKQREVGVEYPSWVSKLMNFDFDIQYKPHPSNRVADDSFGEFSNVVKLGTIVTTCGVPTKQLNKEFQQDFHSMLCH